MAKHEIKDLPSNSIKGREIPKNEEPKKIEKVVSGEVVPKKIPWYKKAIAAFIGEDVDNVGDYILYDVLIPAFKDTLSDMVSGGMDMLLFGKSSRGRASRYRNGSFDYNGISKKPKERERYARSRRSVYFRTIEDKEEVDEAYERIWDLFDTYNTISAAEYYELTGVEVDFQDNKYGWDNISDMKKKRVQGGWIIEMPDPIDFN